MKRRRVLAAILGLPAGVLLTASKCGGGGGTKKVGPHVVKPEKGKEGVEPPPVEAGEDWPVDGVVFRELQISAWFSPDAWPYVIEVIATDHSDNNREIRLGKHHVEQGQFVCPVTWEATHDVSLVISWHCQKAPDRGGIVTRERNHRGGQVSQGVDAAHRQDFTWNMSPRRR